MLTTASSVLETRSSWARRRSDKATSSSPRKRRASTDSALITIWAHLPRSLLILKSQYGLPLSSPFCSLSPWGGFAKTWGHCSDIVNDNSAYRGDCHLLTSSLYLRASQVENEARAELPSKQGTSPEQTSALEESIYKVSGQLSTINRMQKYFRTRENRNFSTVKSTESRIFNFSVVESGLMVCMAGLQVFIVRFFFQGARKGRLPYSQRGGV